MKNLLFILLGITFLSFGCGKDDEPKDSIDNFVGTITGALTDYTCATPTTIEKIYDNATFKSEKIDTKKLSGSISDKNGTQLFAFIGVLATETSDTLQILNFTSNSKTYFGQGVKNSGKLTLIFADNDCPHPNGGYQVVREFIQK